MAFLDVRSDDIERESRYPTVGAIEAMRTGTVLAYNAKAYEDWARRYAEPVTQSPAEYRAAIAKLARIAPRNVTVH